MGLWGECRVGVGTVRVARRVTVPWSAPCTGVSGMRDTPSGASPTPPSAGAPRRGGPAVEGGGRGGAAHDGGGHQPAPAGAGRGGAREAGGPGSRGRGTARPSVCRTGLGASRATGPGAGLLGRAAPDSVRGLPHGSRYLARGGALLDRRWARPVRAGRRRRRVGGRAVGAPAGGRSLWGVVLAGTCRRWSGPPRPSSSTTPNWTWMPQAPTSPRAGGGCSSGQPLPG